MRNPLNVDIYDATMTGKTLGRSLHRQRACNTVKSLTTEICSKVKNKLKENILHSYSGDLILDLCGAARHNWPNSKVCRSSENCDSSPLSSLYFLHSLKTVCGGYSSPCPSGTPPHSAGLTTPLLTQNKHRTLIKCYLQLMVLTLQRDKAMWEQRSSSSSWAVNPAHVLMLRK